MLANALAKEFPRTNREGHNLSPPQAEHTHDIELAMRIAFRDESVLRELYATYSQRLVLLSTHFVEDIGQTFGDMAVLSRGRLIFHGSPTELMQAAEDHVWMLTTPGQQKPNHNLTVVSMLHLAEGVQYRLVGTSVADHPQAQPTPPGLEDGYVWLMKSTGQTAGVLKT
jgi:ABC-type multidrug transport system ATPase subunit